MNRRLCKESALRAKEVEQNVKVRNRGGVGALWRRTEAEGRSTVQIAKDGGGAVEDGGAAAKQVAVHLRSPDLHPSIPAYTQIPMLMTQRVSVTISRVKASI